MDEVSIKEEARQSTGSKELDRVLGGGGKWLYSKRRRSRHWQIHPDTKICEALGRESTKVLYASGEESVQQIKMRANRLGVVTANLHLVANQPRYDTGPC